MALRFWIWTALLTLTPSLFATDCSVLNKRWQSRFHQAFGVEGKKEFFECVDTQKNFVIAQALDDLYETDLGHNYYETARRLIHKLTLAPSCEDRVAAFMGKQNKVSLCDPFFKLSRLRRAAILFHEASHGRAKDPAHVVCLAGEAKGKDTCDATLSDGYEGSGYNWEAHYVRYVSQNSTDNDLKKAAQDHLKFLLENRINNLSEQTKKAWLD